MRNHPFPHRLIPLLFSVALLSINLTCAAQTSAESADESVATTPQSQSERDILPATEPDGATTRMDFNAAVNRMALKSPKLAAAKAEVESKKLQSDAAKWLGGPNVILHAGYTKYSMSYDVDLTEAKQLDLPSI